jgi:hypothetical protein
LVRCRPVRRRAADDAGGFRREEVLLAAARQPGGHVGIGRTHAHTPVLILVTTNTVCVISKTSYQLIASHHIDPDHNYGRNQQKNPG